MFKLTKHQQKQIEVIDQIEGATKNNKVSVVAPVGNFALDPRLCLTTVHFPKEVLIKQIMNEIVKPLASEFPEIYFYEPSSLHTTIKNVRIIKDPPSFSEDDIRKVEEEFSKVVPKRNQYRTYFYRLLLLPNSLSLVGTTDQELDKINLDLDKALNRIGLPDDKKYINKKYFLSNVTIARFENSPSEKLRKAVSEISESILFPPYLVDSVTLISANAAVTICRKIHTWRLKS